MNRRRIAMIVCCVCTFALGGCAAPKPAFYTPMPDSYAIARDHASTLADAISNFPGAESTALADGYRVATYNVPVTSEPVWLSTYMERGPDGRKALWNIAAQFLDIPLLPINLAARVVAPSHLVPMQGLYASDGQLAAYRAGERRWTVFHRNGEMPPQVLRVLAASFSPESLPPPPETR